MIPYGSLVVYVTPNKDRRYIKRLEEGQDWHSNDGVLSAEAVHAANFGSEVRTSLDIPIRVLEATLHDRLKGLKRQTQIIYPKDIAYICLRLGAGPGRTIIEAGCGSGGLTTGLSWFCGPTGRVVSHEAREEFMKLARRNLELARRSFVMTSRTIRGKVLSYLSTAASAYGTRSFDIPYNREQLASYLGVDRSALSGELGRMQRAGLIRFKKNHFELLQ